MNFTIIAASRLEENVEGDRRRTMLYICIKKIIIIIIILIKTTSQGRWR